MTKEKLRARTRDELLAMARKRKIAGSHGMRKDQLVDALLKSDKPQSTATKKKPAARSRPQPAAARNTSATESAEEQVERSKFDVGVPTRDLSAKIPKAL